MTMPEGVLVGGEPAAILAASSNLHEVAFRTDDVAVRLAQALGPAGTTVLAAAPFAPLQARAVLAAIERLTAGPAAGLGTVATAYEAAALLLRNAGQALELAGVAAVVTMGAAALLAGDRPQVLGDTGGVDVRRETVSSGGSVGPIGLTGNLSVREVARPDGTTFYVVEASLSPRAAASLGAQVNGTGGLVESSSGTETIVRWAVPTRHDAELIVGGVGAAALLGPSAGLPRPTEVTQGTMVSASGTATATGLPLAGSVGIGVRTATTTLASGGTRQTVTLSSVGQAAVFGLAGAGGAATLLIGLERDRSGALTKLSVVTTEEVDQGRHGLAVLEAGNLETILTERQWDLPVTPRLAAHAERIGSAIAERRAPDDADVRAVTRALTDVRPEVRTYDARHQQASLDLSAGEVSAGASLGIDTATLQPR